MKPVSLSTFLLLPWAAAALPSTAALAQWTAIDLTPPGMQGSLALAIFGDTQAGSAGGHAALWYGTPESFIDLNPPGADSSWITAISEDQQVGTARIDGLYYGGVWSGTPESWRPLTSGYSQIPNIQFPILGVAGGTQVGFSEYHAYLWRGTPQSVVDLTPPGTVLAKAFGTDGYYQVGRVDFPRGTSIPTARAGVWTGTASSWMSLPSAPAPYTAAVGVAISDGQVAGYTGTEILSNTSLRAALWTSFNAAPIDLTPPDAYTAQLTSISHGWQAGTAGVYSFCASAWHGSAASWENLNAILPPVFQQSPNYSYGYGVWADPATVRVVGTAFEYQYSTNTHIAHAFLWTRPTCYPNCDYSTQPPTLNVADFLCFESKFAAGDMYANCDGSTLEPRLSVNDFLCFLNKFAAGCD